MTEKGDQNETPGVVTLVFQSCDLAFPEPVEEHRACERVARLPFIQPGIDAPAQVDSALGACGRRPSGV